MDKKKRDLQATFEAKVKQRQNKLLEMKREFARKHEGVSFSQLYSELSVLGNSSI